MKEHLLSLRKKCQGKKEHQDQVREIGRLENKIRSAFIRREYLI